LLLLTLVVSMLTFALERTNVLLGAPAFVFSLSDAHFRGMGNLFSPAINHPLIFQ
jgi:hypothetical protein